MIMNGRIAERTGPRRENEKSVFFFAIERLDPNVQGEQMQRQLSILQFLEKRPGFAGILPGNAISTLVLFETREQAEMTREELFLRKCRIGENIWELCVPKDRQITTVA